MEYIPDLISVIMGIYNCADTLSEAIDSILAQTYDKWELILCDDGSMDDTFDVAEKYASLYPFKIILLKNEANCGLNFTLNKCLKYAKGEYIARMDGDDISTQDRFSKEISVLQENPEYAIVSTPMIYFDEHGDWGRNYLKEIPQRRDLIHGSPHNHAPCVIRHEAFCTVNGYTEDERLLRVEDYDLWVKLYAAGYRGYNLSEPLYKMRDDYNAYKRRNFQNRINEAYSRTLCVRRLELPIWYYLYALRPILVGLLPQKMYDILHKHKLRGK
ncbi:MAG: glycosyltransferase [Lachnospiraceae bacterium]|nr:glycosyltransferase [Lachnospiraceae bacterium]